MDSSAQSDDLPVLISAASPSAARRRSNNDSRKMSSKAKMSFDPASDDDDDQSTSTLGDESSPDQPHHNNFELNFMKELDESLLEQYDSSDESSYWSSSDEETSDDDETGTDTDRGSHTDLSGTDEGGFTTDTDDEVLLLSQESPTKLKRKAHKRNDSTLSLDALLSLQMQLGDAKKPPPKDREARRRGRRLNRDHNATSLGALARKVGSSTGNDRKQEVTPFRRSESATAIPTARKKFHHFQQAGSAQDQEPPPLGLMMDQSSHTIPANNRNRNASFGTKRATQQPHKYAVTPVKPKDHYLNILKTAGIAAPLVPYDTLHDFFLPVTADDKAAFDMELVGAVRDRNLPKLHQLYQVGHPMQARSQFGESLVHICARRGTPEMLRWLLSLKESDQGNAAVSCHVCCDYGRTPLHDAAWSTDAVSLEMMKILISDCPDLLLVLDRRGFMPLDYIPKERWAQCCAWLDKHKELVMPTGALFGESDDDEDSDRSSYEGYSEDEESDTD